MDLRKVAAKFETIQFEAFDEGGQTWASAGFSGKISPVDRFLSNFNRPTKRRHIGFPPGTLLPASYTIRTPETGDIYVLGEVREDVIDGAAYDTVAIGHKCIATGTVTRRAPAGLANNPGHLVSSQVGLHYMDVELRAVQEVEEHVDEFEGNYFVMFPPHADVQGWDHVSFQGRTYRIKSVYDDSGFKFARAISREDPRIDFIYHHKSTSSDYAPGTGVVTGGFVDYNVTGFRVTFREDALNYATLKATDFKMVVDEAHIGIVPTDEDELTVDGQRYKIKGVSKDFLDNEYKLHCTL